VTLTKATRDAIGRTVAKLRGVMEEECSQQARGTFGLHASSRSPASANPSVSAALRHHVEPEQELSLSPEQRRQRHELIGALQYLVAEGASGSEAVERLIREAAFTAVNRILAIRVAEAVGVLPESLGLGRRSAGYRETIGELFPVLQMTEDEGYWAYLTTCGDEFGASVPLLFDRRSPLNAFVPSRSCLDEAIELVNAPEVAAAWGEPEALGWAYQFFNSETERQEMRAASQAPRTSRELAVRNQFFTPRYVVDWLVDNTLGRRLRAAGYELDLPLLEGEDDSAATLKLADVRILDPAVGSGHFLLGCYDLLERAWASIGVAPHEAAPRILATLHGIDIDPRASQVAQAVLLLRAGRSAPGAPLTAPKIVTARSMPRGSGQREELPANRNPDAALLVDEMLTALADAPELGSLLKVEERLAAGLGRATAQPQLTDAATQSAQELERLILEDLESLAAAVDATPAARLFSADARDAVRFVELCKQRYDVVLMNPPFGDAVPETRDYLRAAYGDAAVDVYAAFVSRGAELLRRGGHVGAITSRSGFFLTSFRRWRTNFLLPRVRSVLDLGLGVMHDAMVEAAAYVIASGAENVDASFRRLVEVADKDAAVRSRAGETWAKNPGDFRLIPEAPAAYWLRPELLELFRRAETLEGDGREVRVGLQTSDDFRFVRLWWEVPTEEVGHEGRRWVPFAKGGEYSPYFSDLHLVVDWEDDGSRIREQARARGESESRVIRSRSQYFRPGITWSYRSQKGFAVRPVPAASIFGHKGPMVFLEGDDSRELSEMMAYLNSSLAASLLEAMVAFGSYEVGAIQRLPLVLPGRQAAEHARQLTNARRLAGAAIELDHGFQTPWCAGSVAEDPAATSGAVDALVLEAVDAPGDTKPLATTYSTRWFEESYSAAATPEPDDELSYLVGVALGRFDVRVAIGERAGTSSADPFAPLPRSSPGMLAGSAGEHPLAQAPDDYPFPTAARGLLVDDPGHPDDLVVMVERIAVEIREAPGRRGQPSVDQKVRDLRRYLRTKFFRSHVKRYSMSRRVAPLFWHLTVPSRSWGIWFYAPKLSREALFAIAQTADEKVRQLESFIQTLRIPAAADRATRERLEGSEGLLAEARAFADHARHVAQSGWSPDLNDGTVLNAAPLEPLFQERSWLTHISNHRTKLEKGEYPWASVQRTYFGGGT
jgi:predicted RNA methylase